MNQRIAVRVLAKKGEKVLLLRRAQGRQTILGKCELPGGRVEYGEQPEDALIRHVKESTGATLQTLQLSDVLTYIDHENRDIQYAVILYSVVFVAENTITLNTDYDHYVWRRPSEVQQDDLTNLTQLLLNIHETSASTQTGIYDDENATPSQLVIFTDGGSRGNPGPSAAGYVVLDAMGRLLDEGGSYLGITTNNLAEYHGVHLGLEKARELGAKTVEFRLDSLLVVNQLNGTYVIRNRELWPIHERIRALLGEFDKVTFRHIKRELNQRADGMVNSILDTQFQEKV